MSRPHCITLITPDKTAYVCAQCPDREIGIKWAEGRGYDISQSICPVCSTKQLIIADLKTESRSDEADRLARWHAKCRRIFGPSWQPSES